MKGEMSIKEGTAKQCDDTMAVVRSGRASGLVLSDFGVLLVLRCEKTRVFCN